MLLRHFDRIYDHLCHWRKSCAERNWLEACATTGGLRRRQEESIQRIATLLFTACAAMGASREPVR